ncbi:MAG: hypothetical protein AB7P69_17060 [Candidatus Binatia bacterium]
MKANLKKMLGLAALGMTLLTNAAPTWAGAKVANQVSILSSGTITWASGNMVGARYSGDKNQNIGCVTYALPYPWVSCSATDKVGNTLLCGSSNPKWVEAAQGITDSSNFYIQLLNNNYGDCGYISITNNSAGLQ